MGQPPLSLSGILATSAPIQDLERLWLESSCYYAVFDENILEDTEWDHLSKELWARRLEMSPYFAHACNLSWPNPQAEDGENPLVTASGVNWHEGLPAIVSQGIRKEGRKRITLWKHRLDRLRKQARKDAVGERLGKEWQAEADRRKAQRKGRSKAP
jgi:hypothetical protein